MAELRYIRVVVMEAAHINSQPYFSPTRDKIGCFFLLHDKLIIINIEDAMKYNETITRKTLLTPSVTVSGQVSLTIL